MSETRDGHGMLAMEAFWALHSAVSRDKSIADNVSADFRSYFPTLFAEGIISEDEMAASGVFHVFGAYYPTADALKELDSPYGVAGMGMMANVEATAGLVDPPASGEDAKAATDATKYNRGRYRPDCWPRQGWIPVMQPPLPVAVRIVLD